MLRARLRVFAICRVEPFLISASVVLLIIAQRLIRVICPQCRAPYDAPKAILEKLIKSAGDQVPNPTVYQAKGCEFCNQTGYKGRKGLYEIFKMTSHLREMTVDPKTSLEDIRAVARADGMKTLFEEGAIAVLSGQTSVEEMMRVCTLEE